MLEIYCTTLGIYYFFQNNTLKPDFFYTYVKQNIFFANSVWTDYLISFPSKSEYFLTKKTYPHPLQVKLSFPKLFNIVLNTRLTDHLTKRDILTNYQAGFRNNSRTTDHIFILKCLVDKYTNNKVTHFMHVLLTLNGLLILCLSKCSSQTLGKFSIILLSICIH